MSTKLLLPRAAFDRLILHRPADATVSCSDLWELNPGGGVRVRKEQPYQQASDGPLLPTSASWAFSLRGLPVSTSPEVHTPYQFWFRFCSSNARVPAGQGTYYSFDATFTLDMDAATLVAAFSDCFFKGSQGAAAKRLWLAPRAEGTDPPDAHRDFTLWRRVEGSVAAFFAAPEVRLAGPRNSVLFVEVLNDDGSSFSCPGLQTMQYLALPPAPAPTPRPAPPPTSALGAPAGGAAPRRALASPPASQHPYLFPPPPAPRMGPTSPAHALPAPPASRGAPPPFVGGGGGGGGAPQLPGGPRFRNFVNLGNTCWLSASLQALSSAEKFAGLFLRGQLPRRPFSDALSAALRECAGAPTGGKVSPEPLEVRLRAEFPGDFGVAGQQRDAHTFFCRLLDRLIAETGGAPHPAGYAAVDWRGVNMGGGAPPPPSPVRDLVGIRQHWRSRCRRCGSEVDAERNFESTLVVRIPKATPVWVYHDGTYTEHRIFHASDSSGAPLVAHAMALLLQAAPGEALVVTHDVLGAAAGLAGAPARQLLRAFRIHLQELRFVSDREAGLHEELPSGAQGEGVCFFDARADVRASRGGALPPPRAVVSSLPPLSLLQCFQQSVAPEQPPGWSPDPCATCGGRNWERFHHVGAAPDVLLVNLARFRRTAAGSEKSTSAVSAPLALDTLFPLVEKRGEGADAAYALTGVVHHRGALSGGHYTATVRAPDGRWLRCDDLDARGALPAEDAGAFERYLRQGGEDSREGFQPMMLVYAKTRAPAAPADPDADAVQGVGREMGLPRGAWGDAAVREALALNEGRADRVARAVQWLVEHTV